MDGESKKLLPGWEDSRRLALMFAPLPPDRASNPSLWDSKLDFWLSSIANVCKLNKSLGFVRNELEIAFKHEGLVPKGLDRILIELVKAGKLRNIKENNSKSLVGWLVDMVWDASKTIEMDDAFVITEMLEEYGEKIIKWHEEHKEDYDEPHNIVPWEQFAADLSFCSLPKEQQNLILEYLKTKQIIVEKEGVVFSGGRIYSKEGITTVLRTKTSLYNIDQDITKLLQITEACRDRAKQKLEKNNRNGALIELKRKRVVENALENRYVLRDNLQNVLNAIVDAHTGSEVAMALKQGTTALKELHEKLNTAAIEEVLDDIEDAVQVNSEITGAVSAVSSDTFPQDDYEKELDNLIVTQSTSVKADPVSDANVDNTVHQLASLSIGITKEEAGSASSIMVKKKKVLA